MWIVRIVLGLLRGRLLEESSRRGRASQWADYASQPTAPVYPCAYC